MYKGLFRIGNVALHNNIIIFSMNSAIECPSRKKGLCRYTEWCYAYRCEKRYKSSVLFKKRCALYWNKVNTIKFINDISAVIDSCKKTEIKFFRFNESGDFRNQSDVIKLSQIAFALKIKYGIVTYGYTARSDLDFNSVPFKIKGSEFSLKDGRTEVIIKPEHKLKGFEICPKTIDHSIKCGLQCKKCMLASENLSFIKH